MKVRGYNDDFIFNDFGGIQLWHGGRRVAKPLSSNMSTTVMIGLIFVVGVFAGIFISKMRKY